MHTITIYTTGPACGACTATKSALKQRGIEYTEVVLSDEPAAQSYVTDVLGYSQAPVCVVEDGTGQNHWSGFRLDHIKRLAAAG